MRITLIWYAGNLSDNEVYGYVWGQCLSYQGSQQTFTGIYGQQLPFLRRDYVQLALLLVLLC